MSHTAQKMKFFIKELFSKCDQICWKLFGFTEETIDLLKKSLTENSIFYAVHNAYLSKTCSSESMRQED